MEIAKNCGSDKVCIPDLAMEASVDKETFVIGADEQLNLDVKVRNNKEDAFESQFFLSIPPGLEYIAYKRLSKGQAVTCSTPVDFEVCVFLPRRERECKRNHYGSILAKTTAASRFLV